VPESAVNTTVVACELEIVLYDLQCRKFKGSEAVRRQAGVIYNKFKSLFQQSSDVCNIIG